MAIRPITGGGSTGGGSGRQTVLLPGSPFASRASLITASQANPAQLFNSNTQVTIAVVAGSPTASDNGTFEWTGSNGSYNGDFWVDFNGLDAADIKALYESNPNTNAFTNNQQSSVNSVIALTPGVIPVAIAGGFANSPITQPNALGINVDGTIQTTKDTLYVGQSLSISEDGLDIRADNIVEGISALPVRTVLNSDGTTGANVAVVRSNRQTAVIQGNDTQNNVGRIVAWFPVTATRIVKQIILRFGAAGTGIRLTLRDATTQTQTDGPILYQSHTTYDWNSGGGFSVPATGDFTINIENSAKFVQGRFVYAVLEQNTQGTGTLDVKGASLTIAGITQFYPYLSQTFVTETQAEIALKAGTVGNIVAGSKITVNNTVPASPVVSWTPPTSTLFSASFSVVASNADQFQGGAFIFNHASGSLVANLSTANLPLGYEITIGHFNASAAEGTSYSITPDTGTINGGASFMGLPNTVYRVVKSSATTWNLTAFYGDLRTAFVSASTPTAGTLRLTSFNGTNTDIAVGGGSGAGKIYFFPDASNTLTAAQVKTALATANSISDWTAQSLNTLTTDYTTTAGLKYMWIAVPSSEAILSAGISENSGATFVGVGPSFSTIVDSNGINYRVYVALTAFNFTGVPYRFRFTIEQAAPVAGTTPSLFIFSDASANLSSAQIKTAMATAFSVSDWTAQAQNTLTDNISTSTGNRYLYVVLPSNERITAFGVSFNSGVAWSDLTPLAGPIVDRNGTNYQAFVSSATANFTGLTFRARFTTAQAVGQGISYTGQTPAAQELVVGTGVATTAQRSGITLVGGRIPNTAIGVNAATSTGSIQLDNQSNWQTWRFRRIQFTGPGNYVRGIQTLPYIGGNRAWLNVGDWVEVMNIGGTGNYNCQIQTANIGENLTGSLVGAGPTIGISQTDVYRITYTGSPNTWLVSMGAAGTEGGDPVPQMYWNLQEDGTGIQTLNDVEIKTGPQLKTQKFSAVGSAVTAGLNSCTFTFTNHVGAASFFKYLSNDTAFPAVYINQSIPSMDAAAALSYLDNTVLNAAYTLGRTVQPDGLGQVKQFTYQSGTTMRAYFVQADSANIDVGVTIRIGGAVNSLNNGDFVITAYQDLGTYLLVDYTNANASADLNDGDSTYVVGFGSALLFWRTTIASQGTQWTATCQFGLNSSFSILAEVETNWFTPGAGHVSWLDDVYQEVVTGGGGNLVVDGSITTAGNLTTTGSVTATGGVSLAGKLVPSAPVVSAFGDSLYFDVVANAWRVGAVPVAGKATAGTPTDTGQVLSYNSTYGAWVMTQPLVCQLPVPQTSLTSANQWQVLTYDGTGMSMQFPRFAGYPVSRIDTLQNGDSVRYDSTAQTWYNSRTAGSCAARRHSTTQSIGNAIDTRVAFDTGDSFLAFNSGEVGLTYDSSSNVGRFTNTSGRRILISVSYQVNWAINNSGLRFTWIRVNGILGNRIGYEGRQANTSSDVTVNNGNAIFALDNGQYFEVFCYQNSGSTINIGVAAGGSDAGYGVRIQIARLNP